MADSNKKSTDAQASQGSAAVTTATDTPAAPPVDPFMLRADEAPEGGRFWVNGVLVDSEGRSEAEREADAQAEEARRKADQAAAEAKAAAAEQATNDLLAAQKAVDDEVKTKREQALANRPKPVAPKPTPTV